MSLRQPYGAYGLHMATLIDRSTKAMSRLYVLGDFEAALNEENVPLRGGSSGFPWAVGAGEAEATVSMEVRQFTLDSFKKFCGVNPSSANYAEDTDGDATGAATTITNQEGTSVVNATTGIASVGVKSGENPAFGNYRVVAASATTVDVYLDNNLDGVAFQDEALKITATPLTIATDTPVTIPNTGLELTGGSGTIGMTTADSATFSAKPINAYNFTYQGGGAGTKKEEFGLRIFFEKAPGNQYRTLYLPRVVSSGISATGPVKDWSSFETEMMILQDNSLGYAWEYQMVNIAA